MVIRVCAYGMCVCVVFAAGPPPPRGGPRACALCCVCCCRVRGAYACPAPRLQRARPPGCHLYWLLVRRRGLRCSLLRLVLPLPICRVSRCAPWFIAVVCEQHLFCPPAPQLEDLPSRHQCQVRFHELLHRRVAVCIGSWCDVSVLVSRMRVALAAGPPPPPRGGPRACAAPPMARGPARSHVCLCVCVRVSCGVAAGAPPGQAPPGLLAAGPPPRASVQAAALGVAQLPAMPSPRGAPRAWGLAVRHLLLVVRCVSSGLVLLQRVCPCHHRRVY